LFVFTSRELVRDRLLVYAECLLVRDLNVLIVQVNLLSARG
jgi:hypothetical protein